jgi:ABC-2 type transport system ATP-binding protein
MPDPGLALELDYVEKRYGRKVHALKGVSLKVRRGEVFGLLGPNGAGKSTLVKILMTVVRPTRASGWVLGEPMATKSALRRVGYLPENHRFPRYLTGRQVLEFFGALSGATRDWRRTHVPQLLEAVGMAAWADHKVGQYSKGMLQRVGIAQALAANPDLVVLDEPTDGVDPVGRRDIRDVLLRLKAQGKTVFINSHLLSELEMVCDRVAIMVSGQVARQGTMSELAVGREFHEIDAIGPIAATLTTLGWTPPPPHVPPDPQGNWTAPDGRWASVAGTVLRIGETDPQRLQPVLDALRATGCTLRRLQLLRPTLEDLFMEAVQAGSKDGGHAAGASLAPSPSPAPPLSPAPPQGARP